MIFSTWQFIFLFLPICFIGYFSLIRVRYFVGSRLWLVLCSLFFYGYWNTDYLIIILFSLLFNYALGTTLSQSIAHPNKVNRKICLTIGVIFNIFLLGYFKYANFITSNINSLTSLNFELPDIILPLAISFFTFQQIAYLLDSYKGETSEYDLLNYMLFVTFFPQLIAGPIVHHKEMMSQFNSKWNLLPRQKNIAIGLFLFSLGLFKKLAIADTFSIWADIGFSTSDNLNLYDSWVTSLSYTFQLYFDFSGYCDMAMGIALLFNIKLPLNFNSPYKSLDIQDFWRRWHITLGRFLRDYIYIPLGGSRNKEIRTYSNLFITFLIGGIWHGASWMFVIWGALHGIALVTHRIWKSLGGKLPRPLAWALTFLFINLSWVFFRAENMTVTLNIIKAMFDVNSLSIDILDIKTDKLAWLGTNVNWLSQILPNGIIANILSISLIFGSFIIISRDNAIQMSHHVTKTKVCFAAVLFSFSVYLMVSSSSSTFLYFNF